MRGLSLRSSRVISVCMHTEKMHAFYLKECEDTKSLIVIEEDLLTNGLVNTFVVPKGQNIEATGYILQFSRKTGFLMLSYPPCRFVIWDVTSAETVLFTETRGKNPYFMRNFSFNESSSVLFFTAVGQRNIYCCQLVEESNAYAFSKYTKLQLPKKIAVYDLKSQPNDKKIAAACSDGCIRIWNSGSLSHLNSIPVPVSSQQTNDLTTDSSGEFVHARMFYTCMEFSNDGSKLLLGTNYGHVYCYDARQLGNRYIPPVGIVVGTSAILSCKWLNYNGFSATRNMNFLVYTAEVSLTLFNYTSPPSVQGKALPADSRSSGSAITKAAVIFSQRQEIKFQDYYSVNMVFEKLLQVHQFANVVVCTTIKQKQNFDQTNRNSFQRTARVFMLYDQLYDTLDFPLVSPQITHPLSSLIPNKNKQIPFQREQFTVDNLDVKMVSCARETIKTVASLKNILNSDDIRFYHIDTRPIKVEYSRRAKYLLFYKMDDHSYTTSFNVSLEKDEEESKKEEQIVNYLAIQSQQAVFLGESRFSNPPVFYLNEDFASYTIDCHLDFIDAELKQFLQEDGYSTASGDQLSKKDILFMPVRRIFTTPLRRGFTLLYQIDSPSRLCFSRNRILTNKPLDFQPYISEQAPTLRLNSSDDEEIVDIIWANTSTDQPNKQIGAIIYLKKITFINADLNTIKTITVIPTASCNIIHSAKWFAYTLFYITRSHVHYISIDGTTNAILSLDSLETKQKIASIMADRIVIASRSNTKKKNASAPVEFKIKPFSPIEPLICGYLAVCAYQKTEANEGNIVDLIDTFQSCNFSPTLVSSLLKAHLPHLSYFYIYNQENKQLPPLQKVKVFEQMLKTEGILELLFPNRNMEKDIGIIDVIKRVQSDPKFVGETTSLRHLLKYYLMIGEFEQALLIAHLLQDFKSMVLIAKATHIQPLLQQFTSAFLQTKLANNLHPIEKYILKQSEDIPVDMIDPEIEKDTFGRTENFAYPIIQNLDKPSSNNSIRNDRLIQEIGKLDPALARYLMKIVNRKDMGQSKHGFGDTLFTQVYNDIRDEDRDAGDEAEPELIQIEPLHFESIVQYLGLRSHFVESSKAGGHSQAGGAVEQHQGQNDEAAGDEEEDQDENKDILILWRFDEGKGAQIGDLSNNEIEGELVAEGAKNLNLERIWSSFEDNSPLEIEDIWGKKVPVQYSLIFNGGENGLNSVRTTRETWCNHKQKKIKEFTMELWVKSKVVCDSTLIRLMNANETTFELRLTKASEIQVIVRGQPIRLVGYKEDEDDSNNSSNGGGSASTGGASSAQSGSLALPGGSWVHIAIQMEEQNKLTVFLNCKDLFTSEDNIDGSIYELFKGKAIVLGSPEFRGEITEMRLRKEKLQLTQLRDQYKTPLPIVSDKKKKIVFKVADKKNISDVNSKPQFNFGMPPSAPDDDMASQFQSVSGSNTTAQTKNFAFSMPPLADDVIAQVGTAAAGNTKQQQQSQQQQQQPQNKFVFSMPTIIKDNDEVEDSKEPPVIESSPSGKRASLDFKSSTNFPPATQKQSLSSSAFDDFSAFGNFGDSKKDNRSSAFGQFSSNQGGGADFSDPFSSFSNNNNNNKGFQTPKNNDPSNNNGDQFSAFGSSSNDPSAAFGMFASTSGQPTGSGEKPVSKGDFMTATAATSSFFGFNNFENKQQ